MLRFTVKGPSFNTPILFYSQQILCFGLQKTFSFLHIFFFFIAIPKKTKEKHQHPMKKKKTFLKQ